MFLDMNNFIRHPEKLHKLHMQVKLVCAVFKAVVSSYMVLYSVVNNTF